MAKMTEDELRTLTDSEMRQAVGYWGGKLAEQRRKAEYYYLGLAKGDLAPPEIEGRSAVVSTDVRNTIESMLPQLMVKFTGGDTVVEFEPTKAEDEDKAALATDYCNYLFYKKNNGHKVAYTWMKDALLQKVGICKVWWDTRVDETREEYRSLSDVEVAQIMDDDEVTPIDQKSYPDEEDAEHRQEAIQHLTQQLQQAMQAVQQEPQQPQQQMGQPSPPSQAMQAAQQIHQQIQQIQSQPPKLLYDISFKRSKKGGKVTIENVPPEEFLISRKAKDIATASFCAHRVARTKGELRSMGYPKSKIDNINSDDSAATLNSERIERLAWDDEQAYLNMDNAGTDDSMQIIWLTECYIRCDYDDTGIAELRKVTRAGNEILDNEVVDVAPFVSICPIPLPHKFFGLSIADLGMEAQRMKTNLLRAEFDTVYLASNGRSYAVEGQVNLDDLLTSRPGGIVRIKAQGAVGRLDEGSQSNKGVELLNMMEDVLENSTGWTRYSQGNDSQALNKTATGMNIITNKADMRTDLIARNFAEGFVDLFRMMLKLVTQYSDKEDVAKLNGKWIPIDPREWRNQFDVSINVGLGTGNKDQQVGHLMNLMGVQEKTLALGICDAEGVYQACKELAKNMGFKSGDKFFKDPANSPPQPPPPNPDAIKAQAAQQLQAAAQQHEQQMEQVKAQNQAQIEQLKAQANQASEQARMQADAQVEQARAQASIEVERAKLEAKFQVDEATRNHELNKTQLGHSNDQTLAQQKLELEQWKAQLSAETSVLIAQIGAQAKPDAKPDVTGQSDALTLAMQGFQAALERMGAHH